MKFTVQTRGQLTVSQKSKKTYFMIEGFTEGGETQKCICFNPTQYEDFASGKNPDVDIKPRQSGDPSIELAKGGEAPLETGATKAPNTTERNPQEVGLAYKILSELYVNGFIDENKADGKELVLRLKMWLKEVLLNR